MLVFSSILNSNVFCSSSWQRLAFWSQSFQYQSRWYYQCVGNDASVLLTMEIKRPISSDSLAIENQIQPISQRKEFFVHSVKISTSVCVILKAFKSNFCSWFYRRKHVCIYRWMQWPGSTSAVVYILCWSKISWELKDLSETYVPF